MKYLCTALLFVFATIAAAHTPLTDPFRPRRPPCPRPSRRSCSSSAATYGSRPSSVGRAGVKKRVAAPPAAVARSSRSRSEEDPRAGLHRYLARRGRGHARVSGDFRFTVYGTPCRGLRRVPRRDSLSSAARADFVALFLAAGTGFSSSCLVRDCRRRTEERIRTRRGSQPSRPVLTVSTTC